MKVFVGMSGGVDSSLTAALLKEQGYDVTGVYMKNWTQDLPGMRCPWAEDLADAKRVAVQLGIDLKVYDFENEYRQKVVDYMVEEYRLGRTPNPDIMCNQEVKFRLFLDAALADGAEMIATGHYARVGRNGSKEASENTVGARHAVSDSSSLQSAELPAGQRVKQSSIGQELPSDTPGLAKVSPLAPVDPTAVEDLKNEAPSAQLLQAKDANKDQTYFLYRVTGEALVKTLFPLGEYTKSEVREMAKERGLYTAGKKDSQGICFVGQIGVRDFLSQYVTTEPGNIVDKQSGEVLGRHEGAIFYTLGQRQGLGLGGGLPYYVAGKDMDRNEVYVTRDLNDNTLWKKEIGLSSLHWINEAPSGGEYQVRVRHRAPLIGAYLQGSTLQLAEPQRAVTAGQSVVVYDGNICLGGGIVA